MIKYTKKNFLNMYMIANNFRKNYSTKINQTNKNYHIFTLSIPTKQYSNSKYWSAIYSTIHIENYSLEKYGLLNRMKAIELKKIIIVTISDKFVEDAARRTFKDDYSEITITFIDYKISKFFNVYTMQSFIEEYCERNLEIIYIIENLTWKNVCANFASIYIDISGGSNNKKHLLSSQQFRLSLLSYCLLGHSVYSNIVSSFHNPNPMDNKEINYNTNEVINFLIDFKAKQRKNNNNKVTDEKKDHSVKNENLNDNKKTEIIDSLNLENLPKKTKIIYKNKLFGEAPGGG